LVLHLASILCGFGTSTSPIPTAKITMTMTAPTKQLREGLVDLEREEEHRLGLREGLARARRLGFDQARLTPEHISSRWLYTTCRGLSIESRGRGCKVVPFRAREVGGWSNHHPWSLNHSWCETLAYDTRLFPWSPSLAVQQLELVSDLSGSVSRWARQGKAPSTPHFWHRLIGGSVTMPWQPMWHQQLL
jgi:hypothetical protein